MSCKDMLERSSSFIDGDMAFWEWVRFRAHLTMCPPCAEYVRQLGLTVDALKDLPGQDGTEMRGKLLDMFEEWKASDREE